MAALEDLQTCVTPFHALVRTLRECAATGTPLSWAAKELKETDRILGQMRAHFDQESFFQEPSEALEERVIAIHGCFERLGDALLEIGEALATEDGATVEQVLQQMGADLAEMEDALDWLRAEEAARPRRSPVPRVHELLRVADLVLRGDLALDALQERLDMLQEAQRELSAGLGASPLLSLVAEHGQALDALQEALRQEDADLIAAALEPIRETADGIFQAQQRALDPASEATGLVCSRCIAPIAPGQRNCPACGAPAPLLACDEQGASLEGNRDPELLPDFLQHLLAVVERLQAGEEAWSDYGEAVAEVRERTRRSLEILKQIPPPPAQAPSDEMEAYHEAQAAVEDALEKFFEALESLEAVVRQPEDWLLEQGLESLWAAVETMRKVPAIWARLVEERMAREE